ALVIMAKAQELPGVFIEKTAIRFYDNGAIFSSIIGYDGKITKKELDQNSEYSLTDYIGKTGLEKSYEKELRGINGKKQLEVDALGRVKKDLGAISPIPGDDLILNVDEDLQKKIYDSLQEILQKTKTKMAAAVAINPQNGGVLSMVSLPSFDNNLFARGITSQEFNALISNKSLPLLNRCISGEYPPGSTIKPVVAIAALSEGIITPTTIINGLGGRIKIGSYYFRDWRAHAPSDVCSAIAESNDIFFYTIGGCYGKIKGLGIDKMKKYENLFGLGRPTGVDIPGEASGLIPNKSWKLKTIGEKWYIGDSYHAAIGQGYVTVTPLQLTNYIATIANGGNLYSPRIVNRIKTNSGQEKIVTPKLVRSQIVNPDIIDVVKKGMRMTVTSGTAQALKTLPVAVAGKTGTAQFGTQGKTHSWFTAFAPYNHPTIAITVLVENGGEGNSAALPVVKDVLQWYFTQDNQKKM
ncbi:MAG TPA: penicillin-binding protein 2, partial [Candidatus Moranbacteria bacterium]|nr:penicillin-binding protein 2 [Candidatus Moranbacteria bacterium]